MTTLFIKSTALSLFLAALALVAAACGGSQSARTTTAQSDGSATARSPSVRGNAPAFRWLRPAPLPPGWTQARLPNGAVLAYPASWRRVHSDPGAASAERLDGRSGLIAEYLNATPQQGEETLQNWVRFRPAHNADEGDRSVQVLASARNLRFRDGQGSCVIDRYQTTATAYQEIACLVRGPRSTNVVVAAALAARWAQDAPALERAVSAFVA